MSFKQCYVRTAKFTRGDGCVLVLVNDHVAMASELHLFDTREFTRARAVVSLPVRLRQGLHGSWVDSEDVRLGAVEAES